MIEILDGIKETVAFKGINGVRLYHNDESDNYPVHWHTTLEIIMPLISEYTVEIGEIKTTFNKGDIFVIPPGELHTLYAPPTGERLILLFDYSLICNLTGMDSLLHNLYPFKLISSANFPALTERLCSNLKNIEEEYFSEEPFKESSIFSLLIRFFTEIGRASINSESTFPNVTTNRRQEYIEKFMNVCQYINLHCTEEINIDALADLAGFSKFHFSRLFKEFTGITYYDYLIKKRITHAEKLLITPELSITEVAMQSGFNSLSTFNRLFKAFRKCTPSEYKNLNNSRHG